MSHDNDNDEARLLDEDFKWRHGYTQGHPRNTRRDLHRETYSGQERIRPVNMPHNRGWDTRPDPIEKSHINLLYWLITTLVSVVFWVIGLAMVIWLVRLAWRMSIWG